MGQLQQTEEKLSEKQDSENFQNVMMGDSVPTQ